MPCCWAGALPRVCAALHADVLQVDDAAPRAGGHREVLCVPRLCAVTDVRGEVEEVAVLCLPCSAHWPAAFRLGFHSWDCPVCVCIPAAAWQDAPTQRIVCVSAWVISECCAPDELKNEALEECEVA